MVRRVDQDSLLKPNNAADNLLLHLGRQPHSYPVGIHQVGVQPLGFKPDQVGTVREAGDLRVKRRAVPRTLPQPILGIKHGRQMPVPRHERMRHLVSPRTPTHDLLVNAHPFVQEAEGAGGVIPPLLHAPPHVHRVRPQPGGGACLEPPHAKSCSDESIGKGRGWGVPHAPRRRPVTTDVDHAPQKGTRSDHDPPGADAPRLARRAPVGLQGDAAH
mmetsp:Transcript_37640/g.73539  ORF Transcript_37640/g.73539 Transcript_37640/m.73539 type:complete len:216 (-) Transcript_37640:254-901(-)